jgi:Family of unknown function (DUF5923)
MSKYARKLYRASDVITNADATSSTGNHRAPEAMVTPSLETSKALDDLKLLLERFASGRSLDPLLRSISDIVQDVLGPSSNPLNTDLRNFFHDLDTFLQRALAPFPPPSSSRKSPEKPDLYVSSRGGKHALKDLYEHGSVIFITGNATTDGQNGKPKWRTSFQTLLNEYDAYIGALQSDRSTAKFIRSVDNLCASGSDFLELGLALGVTGAKRKMTSKEEIVRGLVGWFIPRMGALFLRFVPIPRVEFQTGKVEGALEFGFAGAGVGVKSDLLPDSVVVRSWNEIRVDNLPGSEGLDDDGNHGIRTSSSNRIHIHVDGVRFSAHNVGYFIRYNGQWPWVEYIDQGLVSVDVGHSSTGGLSVDIELEINSPAEPIAEDYHGEQDLLPFRVFAVKSSIPGLTFRLSRSKHYILNKLFVQPLAGPLVSKIVTDLLDQQMRRALVGLGESWRNVKGEVENKRKQRENDSNEGWMEDYVEAVVKNAVELLRGDEEFETHTRVTMKGLVHTSTRADVVHDQGMSAEHEHVQEEDETVVAIGAGAQLFPDQAGAYDEDNTRPTSEVVVEEVVERVRVVVNGTREVVEGVAEVREEVERAERRRRQRVRFEGIHSENDEGGWRSSAFDL